jgi:hypothetical protein
MPPRASLKNICKKADLYANPINLTFNNEKVYKTVYGGILTIISGLIILGWLYGQINSVDKGGFAMNEQKILWN